MKDNNFIPPFLMIPSVAIKDKNLKPNDKMTLGAILYFERLKLGYCIASNATLSEIAGCSPATSRDAVSRLSKYGYIICEYSDTQKKVRKNIKSRVSLSSDTPSRVSSISDTGIVNQRHRVSSISEQRESNKKEYKREEKPLSSKKKYLLKIPAKDIQEFTKSFNCKKSDIIKKGRDLDDWCEANGKSKKNYKSFLRVALRKDYGEREESKSTYLT